MATKKVFRVPFKKGCMMSYSDYSSEEYWLLYSKSPHDGYYTPDEWRDSTPFEATLEYKSCQRGRSAMTFTFKVSTGGEVTFMLQNFEKLIPKMAYGVVWGTFEFIKRGANYSCRLVEE